MLLVLALGLNLSINCFITQRINKLKEDTTKNLAKTRANVSVILCVHYCTSKRLLFD